MGNHSTLSESAFNSTLSSDQDRSYLSRGPGFFFSPSPSPYTGTAINMMLPPATPIQLPKPPVIQHEETQHEDTQHEDTQHEDTQHDEMQHDETQYGEMQHDEMQHDEILSQQETSNSPYTPARPTPSEEFLDLALAFEAMGIDEAKALVRYY